MQKLTPQQLEKLHILALVKGSHKKTNHILHLILSILTCGLWLIVWLFASHATTTANRDTDVEYGLAVPSNFLSNAIVVVLVIFTIAVVVASF